jgi:hypothetical protein
MSVPNPLGISCITIAPGSARGYDRSSNDL